MLNQAIDTFLEGAGKISAALLGMVNKAGGQIYALLFLSEEPLSLDEIADRLQVSKSNVSINIRLLEDMRLVKKIWVKGSRKDYYEAERVYPRKVLNNFFDKVRFSISEAVTTIEKTRTIVLEARQGLAATERKRADFILKQLDLMGSFYCAADKFINGFFEGKAVNLDILRAVLANPEDMLKKG